MQVYNDNSNQSNFILRTISSAASKVTNSCRSIFNILQASIYYSSNSLLQHAWRALSPKKPLTKAEKLADHHKKCLCVQTAIHSPINLGKQLALGGKSVSYLFRPRKQAANKLDMHTLNCVISVDSKSKIVHVEGMTNFYDLVEETLKFGFLPKVVPELGGITVGGAISGLAVESSSFKYGLFHRTVKEMEVICGDGKIHVCSPDNENSKLFYAMANSYGTFGYILSAKIELVPVKKYVHLEYVKYYNLETYFKNIKSFCAEKDKYDFVDGAIFSKDFMVIVLGNFTDSASRCSNYRPLDIYYKAIQKKDEDYLTTSDYIWRWDTDSFWSTEVDGKPTILQNRAFRKLLGSYFLRSDRLIKFDRLNKRFQNSLLSRFFNKNSGSKNEILVQDVGISIDLCKEFIEWFDKEIGIFPLFICPYEAPNKETEFSLLGKTDLELKCDIGLFGQKRTEHDPNEGFYNRLVEDKVYELNGFKALYSSSFFLKSRFKEIYYFGDTYKNLKEKYDPDRRFLTLFQKCVKNR